MPSIGENIGDVDSGDLGQQHNESGLTAEEQAQFDAMRTGADMPGAGDPPADDAGDGDDMDGDAADGEGEGGTPGKEKSAKEGAEEGDAAAVEGDRRRINYNKHLREVGKHKKRADDTAAELAKERDARTRTDERLRLILEAMNRKDDTAAAAAAATQQQNDDPEPNKDDDPLAHALWQGRQLEAKYNKLEQRLNGKVETDEAVAASNALAQAFIRDAGEFEKTTPDFRAAYAYLQNHRLRELGFAMHGIDLDNADEAQTLSREQAQELFNVFQRAYREEEQFIVETAFKDRKSPASRIYKLAVNRGYRKAEAAAGDAAAAAAAAGGKSNGKGNGAAASERKPAGGGVREEVNNLREGVDASRSLSDGGSAPADNLTPEQIANMSDDDFAEFIEKIPRRQLDAMMGR